MTVAKTDNKIINILIIYVVLLVVPIVKPEWYDLFNAYYITVILFGLMLLRYYNNYISVKKLIIILAFILLQYLALTTSGLKLSIENLALPIMYAINMVSLFVITDSIKIDREGLSKFYKFYFYGSIGFCIYNFIVNFNIITRLPTMSGSLAGLMIASAFRNRNSFGFVLVWAIIAGFYLYFTTHQKKYIVYLSFIGLNMAITFSRNSIITSAIFILVFSWLFFKNQRHKIIYGLISFVGLISIIMSISSIRNLIINALIRIDVGLSEREIAWQYFFNNMDLRDYAIGSGVGSTQIILEPIDFYSYHNSILDLIGTGGILLLFIYYGVVFYLIKYYYSKIREYPLEGPLFLASIVAFQFYCMFESIVLQIGIGFVDVLVAIFIYVLPLLYLKNGDLSQDSEEIKEENNDFISNASNGCKTLGNKRFIV